MDGCNEATAPGSTPPILELDHVFESLAHARRRYLLYALQDAERSLREIATRVTAWEQDVPIDVVSSADVDRVYVSLYHNHVPHLVEQDIVAFDEATGMVESAGNGDQVLAVLTNAGATLDSQQEDHARSQRDEGHS